MNRRRFLATTGAALSIGLAGCLASGNDSATRPGNWLPVPDALDVERYDFRHADVPAVVDHRDEFGDDPLDGYEKQIGVGGPVLRHLGIDLENLEHIVASKTFAVAHGDHDLDAARESVESHGYSAAAEDGGLEVYEREESQGTVAVGLADGVVIGVGNLAVVDGKTIRSGTAPESPGDAVRSIREASEDETGRYASADPYVEPIVRRIGDLTAGWGFSDERVEETSIERGEFAGEEARGHGYDIDGETADFTHSIVFREGEDPPVADVEEWLETERPFREATDYSIAVDENVLAVEGSFDTADLDTLP